MANCKACGGEYTLYIGMGVRRLKCPHCNVAFVKPGVPEAKKRIDDARVIIRRMMRSIDSEEATGATVVATYGPKIIGTLDLSILEPLGFIRSFYVVPKYQGNKIGQRMLAMAQSICREYKRQGVQLNVQAGNTRARAFYEREGFTYAGILDGTSLRYSKPYVKRG